MAVFGDDDYVSSIVKEFRITLPVGVDEFQVGYLHTVAEMSMAETGGGDGVEVITNEVQEGPIPGWPSAGVSKSQYTHKIIHLESKVPAFIRKLAPSGYLTVHEQSWNAHPYSLTSFRNDFMKDNFNMRITTINKPGRANTDPNENVHNLSLPKLAKRVIDKIDIVNDKVDSRDYNQKFDPSVYDHGRLSRDWEVSADPVMTSYKLFEIEFKWTGLQNVIESTLIKSVRRVLLNFFRQLYCTHHLWKDLDLGEIRKKESQVKDALNQLRTCERARGTVVS